MNATPARHLVRDATATEAGSEARRVALGATPEVLAEIYENSTNIAIWERRFTQPFTKTVDEFVASRHKPYLSSIVTPQEAPSLLRKAIDNSDFNELADDVSELVDMFCCLFNLKQTGLRMTVLCDSMCPKFHVDHVPCRLVTTYSGVATQWLPHHLVMREKLGIGSEGKADSESGLYQHDTDIQTMASADVALLKGEGWPGNQNAGLVHRSPAVTNGKGRLLLTLDFSA